jgi:hypothetical protein
MATLVTKATRGAVAGNGWTTPANASADDTIYATAAPAKNGNVTGDWDFAAFTDGEVPVGAVIDSVIGRYQYKVSVNTSISDATATNLNNGASVGSTNDTSKPLADTNLDVTFTSVPTETDLKTVGRIVARFNAHRGNSNTVVTFSLDYIELRVAYHTNTTVTPGTAGAALSAFAPTVTATQNQRVVPGTASIALTGFAPTVLAPRLVTPGTATLSLTALAPTVLAPRLITPGTASLTLAAFAPTVTVGAGGGGITVTPGPASLHLTTFAPTVLTPRRVTPGPASLTLTTFAPTVSTSQALLVGGAAPVARAATSLLPSVTATHPTPR